MNIYLVDDDQLSTFLTKKWLVMEGVEGKIESFLSAEDALENLIECPDSNLPDVILLDLNMPVMDGWGFLQALQPYQDRILKRCTIYILTSSLNVTDKLRSKDFDIIAGFIHKPVRSEDVKMIRSRFNVYS